MNRTPCWQLARFCLCWALWLLAGCSAWPPMEEPELQVTGFKVLEAENLFNQPFELTVQVRNPNDRNLDVRQIVLDFALDGVTLLHGRSQSIPLIPAHGEAEFTVRGSVSLMDAAQLLMQALRSGPDERMQYRLQAKVQARHFWPTTFHVTREGEISLEKARRKAGKAWDT